MRDRNHPSIILWSAGNEIHDTPKPEIAIPILTSLVKTFHANDPTRPVTQALFRPNASHDYEDGLADLLDVVGQNYREQEILKAHADKPTRKIIGTENTHDRNQWVAMRDHPEYSGQFLWAGIDYLGEAGRWPTIGSGSGLLLSDATAAATGLRAAELVDDDADGRRLCGAWPMQRARADRSGICQCDFDQPGCRAARLRRASGCAGRSDGSVLAAAADGLDAEGPWAAHGERGYLYQCGGG